MEGFSLNGTQTKYPFTTATVMLKASCRVAEAGLEPATLGSVGEVSLIYGTCLLSLYQRHVLLFLGAKLAYRYAIFFLKSDKKSEKIWEKVVNLQIEQLFIEL